MVRFVLGIALALSAGCNAVFGLSEVTLPADAAPDAPPDAPLDGDGDGRLDADDNCPAIANADQADVDKDDIGDVCDLCPTVLDDQHDEDGDGVGDLCDNCPGMVNADQLNSDTDQLGDACDSWPAQTDCIARFDGFGSFHDWNVVRGTWSVDADALVQSDPEARHSYLYTSEMYTKPRVVIEGTMVAFGSPGSRNVGVWGAASTTIDATSLLPDGTVGELYDPTAANAQIAVTGVSGGAAAPLVAYQDLMPVVQVPAGGHFVVILDLRQAPAWSAHVVAGASGRIQTGTGASAAQGRAGVRAHGAIVRYDYVSITTWTIGTCPPRT